MGRNMGESMEGDKYMKVVKDRKKYGEGWIYKRSMN
jgi:hypothetical protein